LRYKTEPAKRERGKEKKGKKESGGDRQPYSKHAIPSHHHPAEERKRGGRGGEKKRDRGKTHLAVFAVVVRLGKVGREEKRAQLKTMLN